MKSLNCGASAPSAIRLFLLLILGFAGAAHADQLVYQQTGADLAFAKYGLTGKGVVVAIIDRGIQWQNQDFINPDGTTRIKYMLDMSGQHGCIGNPPINGANGPTVGTPAPVEYTAAQINAALAATGPTIPERDALGHGTATIGMTAGNGRSFANGKYIGIAPEADLIIVRGVVEAVPAHGTEAAQAAFFGCMTQAFQWLDQKITALGEPVVGMINSESTAGPHDGTATVSRLIDQYFGNRPGRAFVLPSGDEGLYADHAGGTFNGSQATVVNFTRTSTGETPIGIWYSGSANAKITVSFSDGTTVGPLGPVSAPYNNMLMSADSTVSLSQWFPGSEFDQVNSTSGDHFEYVDITSGHATTGTLTILGVTGTDSGTFNMYSDLNGYTLFTSNTVPGHINDWATTRSASVTGAYVLRTNWVDIDGINRSSTNQGAIGALWTGSNDGPTRDGRLGISVVAPGQNTWTSYATTSYWATNRSVLVQDGGGFYGQGGAVSGATPIIAGAVALMLQLNPTLTSEQAQNFLQQSATADGFTGPVPNNQWGYGKLNILGALDLMKLVSQCTFSLNLGGQAFTAQGGSGTIAVTAPAGCPWSITSLPSWVTITSAASGTGNGTVTFTVAASTSGQTASFTVAGQTFTIEQQAASIPGLSLIGSMPDVVAQEHWITTFTLVNNPNSTSTARLSLFGSGLDLTGNGNPLPLVITFPQQPELGSLLGASGDQTLAPSASWIVSTASNPSAAVQTGWGQLQSTGAMGGFAIFHRNTDNQEAVVPLTQATPNASSYLLSFDNTGAVNNTGGIVTSVAIANVSAQPASIGYIIRDDTGEQIGQGTVPALPGFGQTSFVLPDAMNGFPATIGKRGTVEFDTPSGGAISVLGVRNTPQTTSSGTVTTLTTVPALANVGTGGGSFPFIASGGDGWQTTFVLINTGTTSAPATLRFLDPNGNALPLPISYPQGGSPNTTASSIAPTLAGGATLLVLTNGAPNLLTGSAQLSTTGKVSGFAIFRHNGQEAVVPIESRNASAYLVAFDNTGNTATGIAVNTVASGSAQLSIPMILRDDTGAVIGNATLPIASNGDYSADLGTPALFPQAANIRGTIEFDAPAGVQIGALGVRTPQALTYTTLPSLVK